MRGSAAARRDILVSVRPQYADQIVRGTKTIELRRRVPSQAAPGAVLLVYSTSPTCAIVGFATIAAIERLSVAELWKAHGKAACIRRRDFQAYFKGCEDGYAIHLSEVRAFARPVPAADLKERFGFTAPQSFMYLRQDYYVLLDDERA